MPDAQPASPGWPLVRALHFERRDLGPRYSFGRIAGRPELAGLRRLELVGDDDDALSALAASPHLTNLRSLSLQGNPSAGDGFRALARSALFESLEELEVGMFPRPVAAKAVPFLLASGRLRRLTRLRLAVGPAGPGCWEVLAANRPPGLTELHWNYVWEPPDLTRSPALLSGLVSLDVSNCLLRDDGLARLVSCPHLAGLRRLNLEQTGVGAAGIAALARSSFVRSLTHLNLNGNSLGDEALAALADLPLDSLQSLELNHLERVDHSGGRPRALYPSAGALAALLRASWVPHLKYLDLRHAGVGGDELRVLAAAPALHGLQSLDLTHNPLDDKGLVAFARSEHRGELRGLRLAVGLSGDPVTNAGAARALAASPGLGCLTTLEITQVRWDREAAEALARSDLPAHLRQLVIAGCGVEDDAAEALARAPWRRLRSLNLSANPLTGRGVRSLAQSPALAGLWELGLAHTPVGDGGLEALAQSPHLTRLVRLDLHDADFGPAGSAALAGSPVVRRLERVALNEHLELWVQAPGLRPLARAAARGHGQATQESED
jgi:hypothetical protein